MSYLYADGVLDLPNRLPLLKFAQVARIWTAGGPRRRDEDHLARLGSAAGYVAAT